MSTLDKWAERVYAETDFGRSVATSAAGLLGLCIYLYWGDWVIAAFCSIIFFPIVRLVASALHSIFSESAERKAKRKHAEDLYIRLSQDEKAVVSEFVMGGGCVLTWGQVNNLSLPGAGVESLIQREILWTSMTADGMRETFVLDSDVFDIGQSKVNKKA
ncbi:MAG: hypothetical protein KJ572_03125 [Gammaproteobacteria bacterium]|nr:hypothetical protein [Gammaproteobacteria bacterium]